MLLKWRAFDQSEDIVGGEGALSEGVAGAFELL